MFSNLNLLLLAVLALLLIGSMLFGRRPRKPKTDSAPTFDADLPPALRTAELKYFEQKFKSERHKLVARIDRAYMVGNANVVLVELKTRNQAVVHDSDVLEMSVQRLAMADETGLSVLLEGWVIVRLRDTGRTVPLKVQLLNEAQTLRRRDEYLALTSGALDRAAAPARAGVCKSCAYLAECQQQYGDRPSFLFRR